MLGGVWGLPLAVREGAGSDTIPMRLAKGREGEYPDAGGPRGWRGAEQAPRPRISR